MSIRLVTPSIFYKGKPERAFYAHMVGRFLIKGFWEVLESAEHTALSDNDLQQRIFYLTAAS